MHYYQLVLKLSAYMVATSLVPFQGRCTRLQPVTNWGSWQTETMCTFLQPLFYHFLELGKGVFLHCNLLQLALLF